MARENITEEWDEKSKLLHKEEDITKKMIREEEERENFVEEFLNERREQIKEGMRAMEIENIQSGHTEQGTVFYQGEVSGAEVIIYFSPKGKLN